MRPGLTAENAEDFAEAAEKDALCVPLGEPLRPLRLAFVLLSLTLLTACQAASSGQPEPVSAGALTKEYQESTTDTRRKYDGREITVKGLAMMAAMMPPSGSDRAWSSWKKRKRIRREGFRVGSARVKRINSRKLQTVSS